MEERGAGLFFGAYSYDLEKYTGPDFSKKVFLFPGQGSAFAGMYADLYQENLILRQRFAAADKTASELQIPAISPYVQSSNAKKNLDYKTRNLALFTLEVGLFEILISKNIKPQLLTAHSFGEYAAMVAAGVISFKDMFKVIVKRDQIIDESSSHGGMWALRLSLAEAKDLILDQNCYISNQNSPSQTVVSGLLSDGKKLGSLLKSKRISFLRLDVPHGYHGPLMKEACKKFSEFIDGFELEIKTPTIPIMSFVEQQIIDKDNFNPTLIKKIMIEQIIEPVYFQRQIEKTFEIGFRNFIEVGPQKILSSFAKDALSQETIKVRTINDFLSSGEMGTYSKTSEKKNISGLLSAAFNKAFSVVTGYEIESIKLKDRLQEDLGIDSIKKAEIVFKVLEEIGLGNSMGRQSIVLSSLSTVDDILTYFDREQRASSSDEKGLSVEIDRTIKSLESVWSKAKLSRFQKSLLRPMSILNLELSEPAQVPEIKAAIQSFYQKNEDRPKLVQLVFRPHFIMNANFILQDIQKLESWFENFCQAWSLLRIPHPWCDQNNHFQFIYRSEDKNLGQALRPFIKSWVLEQGSLTGKIIEVAELPSSEQLDALKIEVIEPYHSFIKYDENAQRFVQDLKECNLKDPLEFAEGSVYLIIGGHKGIGLEISKRILSTKRSKIILLGRSSREEASVLKAIDILSSDQKSCEYYQCDVRVLAELNNVVTMIKEKFGKIDQVINSAGVTISQFLHLMTPEEIHQIISTKFSTVGNLAKIFSGSPTHILNFSSVAGHYGTAGQAVYSLSNAAVDIMSEIFDKTKNFRFQSILWGPWKNTGMTESELLQAYIDIVGLTYIEPQEGTQFAWRMAASSNSVTCILDESSKLRYQVGAADKKSYRQFYSATQNLYLGKTMDVEGLTLTNLPFLRDHKLAGQPIMAASTMIALFAQFGYVLWGRIPQVKKFTGHNFIIIPETNSQLLLDIERSPTNVKLKLKSNFIHSEAEVFDADPGTGLKVKIPRYTEQLDNDLLINSVIETGEAFDFECKVWVDASAKDVVVEFKTSDLPICTEMPLFDRLYQMIEISHQSLGLTAQWRTGKYSIPKAIAQFEIYENVEVTDRLYSIHDKMTVDEKHISGDTYIVTENEEVLLKLTGVQFAFLPQDAKIEDRFKFLKVIK